MAAVSLTHRNSTFVIPSTEETELAIFDGGLNRSIHAKGRRQSAGSSSSNNGGDDNDDNDEKKISRVAFVDMPLQWRMGDQPTLSFSPHSRMGVNSVMILSPQWTGSLSSFADIRGENSGYTQAKVELDYELPSSMQSWLTSTKTSSVDSSSWCKKANLNFGLQARGYHQIHVGGKVVLSKNKTTPWILPKVLANQRWMKRGDLAFSGQYSHWLNRPLDTLANVDDSLGETTFTATQKYGLCTVQSTCTIPSSIWWLWGSSTSTTTGLTPTIDFSVSSMQSYHPWNLRMGWRWHHHPRENESTIRPFWNISLNPKLSDILTLNFNAGWTLARGLTTTCLWKQSLGETKTTTTSQKPNKSSSPFSRTREQSEKYLQVGVQTNWMARRTALLFVWTDCEFRLRIPIGLVPGSREAWMDFSLQSIFLTVLTRVIQDGLAAVFGLHMVHTKANETAQQQVQLRRQKARSDALKQQHLMKRQAQTRVEDEGETGLVIQKALYGRNLFKNKQLGSSRPISSNSNADATATTDTTTDTLTSPDSSTPSAANIEDEGGEECLDVTVPLQFWVQQGQLELPAFSKRNLLGFYDPSRYTTTQQKQQSSAIHNGLSSPQQQQQQRWWKGFVTRQAAMELSSDPQQQQQQQSPLELYIQYQSGGFLYEMTVHDEEGLLLPSPHALQIESKNQQQ
ncbi:hypothetical protein ACA910_016697 [Epithemia clementina (nom. ined.)]